MIIFPSTHFKRALKKVLKKRPDLKPQIERKIDLLREEPDYPSLGLHKLKGEHVKDWGISIEQDLRIIFTYVPDGILLISIGKHEEVY